LTSGVTFFGVQYTNIAICILFFDISLKTWYALPNNKDLYFVPSYQSVPLTQSERQSENVENLNKSIKALNIQFFLKEALDSAEAWYLDAAEAMNDSHRVVEVAEHRPSLV
jgi:hypothetical protein